MEESTTLVSLPPCRLETKGPGAVYCEKLRTTSPTGIR
jgi:hypothetical protein